MCLVFLFKTGGIKRGERFSNLPRVLANTCFTLTFFWCLDDSKEKPNSRCPGQKQRPGELPGISNGIYDGYIDANCQLFCCVASSLAA